MAHDFEDAAKWRRLRDFKKAEARREVLLKEIKLMVVAPLAEINCTLSASIEKFSKLDLTVFPDKRWLQERQRELVDLDSEIDSLAMQIREDGLEIATL